jgi:hypothetical protein
VVVGFWNSTLQFYESHNICLCTIYLQPIALIADLQAEKIAISAYVDSIICMLCLQFLWMSDICNGAVQTFSHTTADMGWCCCVSHINICVAFV